MKQTTLFLFWLSVSALAIGAEQAATNQAAATKEKETYANKADKEVQDWTSKIKSLEEQSEATGAKARAELDRHLKAIHEGLAVAHKKIDAIRASSENAWKSLQAGLERTLADVKRHYQKAVAAPPAAVKK